MTWLLASAAEAMLAFSALHASLKALKTANDCDEVATESSLESALMAWTVFGVLRLWDAILEPWLAVLPLYFYAKGMLVLAAGIPALRIHVLIFELTVTAVDALAGARRLELRSLPLTAFELLAMLPVLVLELLFPAPEHWEEETSLPPSDLPGDLGILDASPQQERSLHDEDSLDARRSESSRKLSRLARELRRSSSEEPAEESQDAASPQALFAASVVRSVRSIIVGDTNTRLRDSLLSPNIRSPSLNSVIRSKRRFSAMGLTQPPASPSQCRSRRRAEPNPSIW